MVLHFNRLFYIVFFYSVTMLFGMDTPPKLSHTKSQRKIAPDMFILPNEKELKELGFQEFLDISFQQFKTFPNNTGDCVKYTQNSRCLEILTCITIFINANRETSTSIKYDQVQKNNIVTGLIELYTDNPNRFISSMHILKHLKEACEEQNKGYECLAQQPIDVFKTVEHFTRALHSFFMLSDQAASLLPLTFYSICCINMITDSPLQKYYSNEPLRDKQNKEEKKDSPTNSLLTIYEETIRSLCSYIRNQKNHLLSLEYLKASTILMHELKKTADLEGSPFDRKLFELYCSIGNWVTSEKKSK